MSVLFCLLPNVFFWLGAYFIGVARPIINIDYFIPCLLFALPYRPTRLLAFLSLSLVVVIDAAMLAMQLFPFLDMNAAVSLAPFLRLAPLRYQVLALLIVAYLLMLSYTMWRLARLWYQSRWSWGYVLAVAMVGYVGYGQFNEYRYVDREGERFAQSDYFYIHSQYSRYKWVADSEFATHFGKDPQMIAIDIARISPHLTAVKQGITYPNSRPLITSTSSSEYLGDQGMDLPINVQYSPSDKVLFIVSESWGVARDSGVQQQILAGIYDRADKLAFLDTGYFGFSGATIEGELRELCGLDVEGGYAFHKVDDQPFKNCLPHKYNALGYQTIAMHGGFSQIYERNALYPKFGFDKTIFAENLPNKRHCSPFNGVCDDELFEVVADKFAKHDKLFFYWLTLTSHSPFADEDITNRRFDCQKNGIPKGDICNNFILQAQFFDGLGGLIAQPQMQGVEVIVVGDHMPPIITRGVPLHPYLQWQDVSWIHFKVKD